MGRFEPYLDAEDLSACVEAGDSPASLDARARPLGCTFPLWLDPRQPFGDLFTSVRATPRGFRYGSVGDNVLGLDWRLPNGVELRLGGRVVKNVTGFDFIRFLNAGGRRFGAPLRLVLRLRPLAEAELNLRLRAPSGAGPEGWDALQRAARLVRGGSWAHSLDACDLHATAQGAFLHLSFRAQAALLPLFQAEAEGWARGCGLDCDTAAEAPDGQAHPWARAKAPLDDCIGLARDWVLTHGGGVHAFLGQGVLQLQDPVGPEAMLETALRELHARLGAQGGHVEHPSLVPDPDAPQARWQAELLRRLEAVA